MYMYTRISSIKQKNNTSFKHQFDKCKEYVNKLNSTCSKNKKKIFNTIKKRKSCKLNINYVFKEVSSAYTKIPKILNNIINKKNIIVIILNISRFSRNVSNGMYLLNKCKTNNNTLIFAQNNIIFNKFSSYYIKKKIINLIKYAESESKLVSQNTKILRDKYNLNNLYLGGGLKYGYKIINNKLVRKNNESRIVDFIKQIKLKKISNVDIINFIKMNSNYNNLFNSSLRSSIKNISKIKYILTFYKSSLNLNIIKNKIKKEYYKNTINKINYLNKLDNTEFINKFNEFNEFNELYFNNISNIDISNLFNKFDIRYRNNIWSSIKIKQILHNIAQKNILVGENKSLKRKREDTHYLKLFKKFKY